MRGEPIASVPALAIRCRLAQLPCAMAFVDESIAHGMLAFVRAMPLRTGAPSRLSALAEAPICVRCSAAAAMIAEGVCRTLRRARCALAILMRRNALDRRLVPCCASVVASPTRALTLLASRPSRLNDLLARCQATLRPRVLVRSPLGRASLHCC